MNSSGVIYIVPMLCGHMDDLGNLAESVEEQFEIRVIILENMGTPTCAYDPGRKQYNSNVILGMLVQSAPPDSLKIVGVTDIDLFNPIFSYVFGEAQFGGKCAVISSYRLTGSADPAEQHRCPPMLDRLEKEAVHELGHTFGLRHCADPNCVMSFSKGIQCADRKFGVFCPACRDLLLWYRDMQMPL